MRQELIMGLPKHLRTEAHACNRADCTDPQLTTYLSGRDTAAHGAMELARIIMQPASSSRRPHIVRHKGFHVTYPVVVVPPETMPDSPQPRSMPPARP